MLVSVFCFGPKRVVTSFAVSELELESLSFGRWLELRKGDSENFHPSENACKYIVYTCQINVHDMKQCGQTKWLLDCPIRNTVGLTTFSLSGFFLSSERMSAKSPQTIILTNVMSCGHGGLNFLWERSDLALPSVSRSISHCTNAAPWTVSSSIHSTPG